MVLSKTFFQFYTVMMHSKLCFLKIALVLFLKEKKNWKKWLHHLFTLKKTLEQAVLQVVIIVIFARITWFLILTLFAQSLVSLIL